MCGFKEILSILFGKGLGPGWGIAVPVDETFWDPLEKPHSKGRSEVFQKGT